MSSPCALAATRRRKMTSERRRFRHRSAAIGVLPGREFASVVGAARGVVTQLDDGRDVQHVVEPAVAGAGEPVADLLP